MLRISDDFHPTSNGRTVTKPTPPPGRRARLGLFGLFLLPFVLLLLGCVGGGGRFGNASSGWSPAAAALVPIDTGSIVNEGATLSPLDNNLTFRGAFFFAAGQILLIDDEQLEVTSVSNRDLRVSRGVNGTTPQDHADQSTIYILGQELVVFVSTKQGEVKALIDDGSDPPPVKWTFRLDGRDR